MKAHCGKQVCLHTGKQNQIPNYYGADVQNKKQKKGASGSGQGSAESSTDALVE